MRSRTLKWIRFFAGCLLLALVILIAFHFLKFLNNNFSKSLISPIASLDSFKQNSSLEKSIQNALSGATGTYAIAIKNLKTGQTYYQNEHKVFDSGSLYKLWVMAEVFNQIKNGSLKIDDVLTEDVTTLNDKFHIDGEVAELTVGTITLSINDALNQMITISHNYAALLLTEKIKLSNVALFLDNNVFKESEVGTDGGSPKTTASDIALFFEKLYNGKLAGGDETAKMLDLLRNQQLNNKIPKKLPEGVIVAHKTGEIDNLTHDGGIVLTKNGDYIIVVLSDSDLPKGAEDRIADISLAVYKYFTH